MDTVTSDMELDASGKRRGQTSKWRQWFSRRPKQESPKAEIDKLGPLSRPTLDTGAVETEENAIASSPAGIEDMNHGQAGPATSKDECEDNEADSDNGGPPAPRPDDTEAEDDGENDDEDNNQDNNQDNSQNNNQDDDEDDEEKAETRPLRDFWAEAWNSDEVGKQRRALLKGRKEDRKPAQANSKKLVDGLIAKTPAKVASYTARWGSDVKKTALGRARSILVSALTVKDLIDAGLKFDPTGYGSAAWAVVSFGLKLVQNDKELMDLTFEACGHLADLMARYSRMEAHYWERKVKNGRPLEDAMVRVYTAILVYAAEVQWSIESSISTRIRKSFLSLTGQPLEDLRRTVEEENAKLEEWQQQIDRERGDDALKKLKTIKKDTDYLLRRVDETARNSYKALGKVNEEELRELYRFLIEKEGTSQADIHKKLQREIDWWGSADNSKWKSREIRRRTSITAVDGFEDEEDLPRLRERLEHDEGHGGELGDWLLQRNEYLEWEKYPQGLLWLYGDSGCGKSILCSTIINRLSKAFARDGAKTKVLVYWYFRFDLDETKRMDLLLVSLLRQLASKCQGFPDSRSLKWFRDHQDTGELPDDTNELLKHLKLFISTVDKDIFIVLDGLDQVPERQRTAKSGPLKLLDIIRKLARKGYPNLHILLASRDEKDIKSCLETNMEDMLVPVNVKQGLGEELNMFVERKLEDMRILNGSQSLKQAVRKRLNLGQDSNFLWAASVLNQVSQSRDAEEIRDVLNKVPDNVVGMYQAALEKVAVKDTKRMKLILLWMLRQQRPLSQAELAAAVGLHSPSAVTEICTRVLIQTSQQSIVVAGGSQVLDVFRFSHFSVQEYLEAVFAGSQEKLGTKLEKVARFIFPLQEDAHIQLTRRCLAILSPCISSQKNKTAAAERGPGSDSDTGHGDVTAANSDAEDTDFDDSRTDARTTSSTTGSKWIEGPARRYASKYWFRHYNMVDRKKASSCEVKDLDSEVCLQFLLDDEKLRFWLKIHNPDGEKDDNVPSPVYYAIKLKLDGILEQLIAQLGRSQNDTVDRKAILDRRGSEGTALQLAAHLGNSDALNALIEHGADVNSEKGPHGTALYASAARGDENAVRKLLDASANCTGTEDGPLGSPLHVAAFRGHDAVIQLLLDCDRVAVDHRAGPFCTALQASCASRQRTTVKLLLDHGADPNIVGGRLGTAAQAALTHPGRSGHKIVETLLDKKAEFLTEPSFWRTAYEIGVFRDSDQGCNIRMGQELPSEGSYQRLLLRYGMPTSPGIDELQEPQQQHLLSAVIHQWTLPRIIHLNSDYLFGDLLCRVPFQDQLDAIKQATPRLELTMQHLRHEDFLYQAMFWSGINYILNRLPSLIRQCLGQVRRLLRREFEESAQVSTSPLFPFRWAIKDFEAGYFRYDEDAWPRRSLVSGFPIRHQPDRWRSPWGEQDGPGPMGSWSRSDLIAMELMQRRRRYKNLEEVDLLPSNDVDRGDSAARKELRLASRPGVWVTSDILDLVKDLLVYSDRCVRYQESVSDKAEGVARKHRNHIVDLTSELFSTIIRLSLVLDGHTDVDDLEQLVDPVRLLTTVRLERIKRFDAICEKDFVPKSTCSHASTENNSESKAQEIAAAVARQVEQTIEDKLAASQADMVREIQSHVSSAVKEEVSRLVEQMQQGLEEKMYEMQRRLAEGQATQAKRGLLWTPRGRSSG